MDFIKNHISATLKEGVIASVIPVKKSSKKKVESKNDLSRVIKLQPRERIITIQRQHIIALVTPLFIISVIFIFFLVLSLGIEYQAFSDVPKLVGWDVFLVALCFITTFAMFSYLYWYFQFYIITNKCILHRHFFRLGGYHSEEVFLDTSPEREITRKSSNFLYSLLDIEDVEVSFQRPGLGEFVFTAPQNPQEIEDALESVTLNKR